MAAGQRTRNAPASRIRRTRPGTLIRPSRALPSSLRRRQYRGSLSDKSSADFSPPAPPNETIIPQAVDRHVAKKLAPPPRSNIADQRFYPGRIQIHSRRGQTEHESETVDSLLRQSLLRSRRFPRET